MMWDANISAGCVAMYLLSVVGVVLIAVGGLAGVPSLGQLGVALVGFAVGLMVLRDNQRTRRMLARPGETVGPMRSVSRPKDWA